MTDPVKKAAWWYQCLVAPLALVVVIAFPFRWLQEFLGDVLEEIRDPSSGRQKKDGTPPDHRSTKQRVGWREA